MKLGIVIGSIRHGRVSDRLAKWVEAEARKLSETEVTMIDLLNYPMPLFNEAHSPQFNPNRTPEEHVKLFIDKIGECDAVILVTPEYNRSYSSVLKNALDYLDFQLKHKPVMLVAHGSVGGAQAVSHLRGVIPGLTGITIPTAVMITGHLSSIIDEKGQLNSEVAKNPRGPLTSLTHALVDLKWYADALSAARAKG